MLLLVTFVPPFKWTENVGEHRVTPAPGQPAQKFYPASPTSAGIFGLCPHYHFITLEAANFSNKRNILITCHTSPWSDLVLEPRELAVRWNSFFNSPEVSQVHFLPYSETNVWFTTNGTYFCSQTLLLGKCKCYLCKKSGALFSRV